MSWVCPLGGSLGPGGWVGLLLLGAYHGLNPGMGWLFAVALGLQRGQRRATLAAVPPIAAGHLIAVGAMVAAALVVGGFLPTGMARPAAGGLLAAFGVWRLLRPRHPRWVGFQVGRSDLALWSALMSTGHGAGLTLLPFLIGGGRATASVPLAALVPALAAVVLHTAAYLAILLAVALLVYERFGLAILRRAWFNVDRLWAWALAIAGVVTMVG